MLTLTGYWLKRMLTNLFKPYTLLLPLLIGLASCAPMDKKEPSEKNLYLKTSSFQALPNWNNDQIDHTLIAFEKSCELILKRDPNATFSSKLGYAGINKDWQKPCHSLNRMPPQNANEARIFFETYFTPYQMHAESDKNGLFTGYYEASLKGSKTKHGVYQTPLLKKPDDLVMVDLGDFRDDLKGRRIAGRVIDTRLKPFEDRAEIIQGALNEDELALVYVDDPIGAFFLQIQGSGRIDLDDGTTMRVGYAGQNGHPYHAIGRTLVEEGHLKKEEVSLKSIDAWLRANPDEAMRIKNTNPSYIFFRELDSEGPIGGSGLPLTPGRSMAIDYTKIPYHAPIFIDVEMPKPDSLSAQELSRTPNRIQRLVVAQDTGGAIRGPVRGDFFWGHGQKAELFAGAMKSDGQSWLFLPKTVSLSSEILKKF